MSVQIYINRIKFRSRHAFFKLCPIFLLTPHERTIGNTAEELHYAFVLGLKTRKPLVFLRRFQIFGFPKVCNKEIFRLQGEASMTGLSGTLLTWFLDLLLTIFFGYLPALLTYFWKNSWFAFEFVLWRTHYFFTKNKNSYRPLQYLYFKLCFPYLQIGVEHLWNFDHHLAFEENFNFSKLVARDWGKEINPPLTIKFNQDKEASGFQKLRDMGINFKNGDWYVCLHNREGGFHQDSHARRNNDIENYSVVINTIIEAGGWVVRMGDPSMTRLQSRDRLIDYPFTKWKSEFMDLFLIKNCRYFLGQNSGILDVAYLFQRQCVVVNMTEWALAYPRQRNSLCLFKHIYSKKHGRFLSLNEVLELPLSSQDLSWYDSNYVMHQNCPEEIREVMIEVLKQDLDYSYSSLQEEFIQKRKRQLMSWLNEKSTFKGTYGEYLFKCRIATRCNGLAGTAGRHYLETNWKNNSRN